ncbi:hypothetical protein WDU94_010716 [Cyamophila willieti]
MLPTYARLLDPVAADSIMVSDPLPNPPIYQNIIAALQALSNASGKQGEEMPRIYSPSEKIPLQPKFESVFSSELQRFFNSIIRARNIANADGRVEIAGSKRELIRVAMEVSEMSIIKDVLSMSLDTMKHLFTIDPIVVVSAEFDDVKTRMKTPVHDMIMACPELYGFTNSVVYSLDHVEIITRPSYEERTPSGLLTSNVTEKLRNPNRRMVHMSLGEMRRHLYDGDLLSNVRETQQEGGNFVRLPIYCS